MEDHRLGTLHEPLLRAGCQHEEPATSSSQTKASGSQHSREHLLPAVGEDRRAAAGAAGERRGGEEGCAAQTFFVDEDLERDGGRDSQRELRACSDVRGQGTEVASDKLQGEGTPPEDAPREKLIAPGEVESDDESDEDGEEGGCCWRWISGVAEKTRRCLTGRGPPPHGRHHQANLRSSGNGDHGNNSGIRSNTDSSNNNNGNIPSSAGAPASSTSCPEVIDHRQPQYPQQQQPPQQQQHNQQSCEHSKMQLQASSDEGNNVEEHLAYADLEAGSAPGGLGLAPGEHYDRRYQQYNEEDYYDDDGDDLDQELMPGMRGHQFQEPTFWYDTGLPMRDQTLRGHMSHNQLIHSHESRWSLVLPFRLSCNFCRKRCRGFVRLDQQRVQRDHVFQRQWEADRVRATRVDGSAVALSMSSLAGNSLGVVQASPGLSGRDLKKRIGRLLSATPGDLEVVLAEETEPIRDEEALFDSPAEGLRLAEGPDPHLHVLRVQRRRAISAAADGSVKLWDVDRAADSGPLVTMTGHTQRVQCVSADFEGWRAVSGSSDGSLKLWDLERGECTDSLFDYSGDYHCGSTDWSRRRTLGGLSNGTLAMWDLNTGSCILALHGGHHGPAESLDVAWRAGVAMSGSTDGGVMLWELETRTRVPMQGHMVWVSDIQMSEDARYAVSGSIDGMIRLWDLRANRCAGSMQGVWNDVKCLSVNWNTGAGGAQILTGTGNGMLKLWDVGSRRAIATLATDGPRGDTNCLSVDWGARKALSGSAAGMLTMWDLEEMQCIDTWKAHKNQVKCVELAHLS